MFMLVALAPESQEATQVGRGGHLPMQGAAFQERDPVLGESVPCIMSGDEFVWGQMRTSSLQTAPCKHNPEKWSRKQSLGVLAKPVRTRRRPQGPWWIASLNDQSVPFCSLGRCLCSWDTRSATCTSGQVSCTFTGHACRCVLLSILFYSCSSHLSCGSGGLWLSVRFDHTGSQGRICGAVLRSLG